MALLLGFGCRREGLNKPHAPVMLCGRSWQLHVGLAVPSLTDSGPNTRPLQVQQSRDAFACIITRGQRACSPMVNARQAGSRPSQDTPVAEGDLANTYVTAQMMPSAWRSTCRRLATLKMALCTILGPE